MSLWRRARTEVAAAWRSVRHDLGRPGPNASPGAWLPQVTPPGGAGEQFVPAPRRLVAVSAFGVLAVAGAHEAAPQPGPTRDELLRLIA